MKIKYSFLLAFVFSISACGGKPNIPVVPTTTEPPLAASEVVPQVTPVCISTDPTQEDIDRALSYTGELFSAPEWVRTYTVADGRVSVVWANDPLAVVAYVEALVFPCGYEEPDLDSFFSVENWDVVFGNYDSYEPVTSCKIDSGVRLYEFSTVTEGFNYNIRYWAENDTDNRLVGAMIVFPVESQSLMDEYSALLFPELVTCP